MPPSGEALQVLRGRPSTGLERDDVVDLARLCRCAGSGVAGDPVPGADEPGHRRTGSIRVRRHRHGMPRERVGHQPPPHRTLTRIPGLTVHAPGLPVSATVLIEEDASNPTTTVHLAGSNTGSPGTGNGNQSAATVPQLVHTGGATAPRRRTVDRLTGATPGHPMRCHRIRDTHPWPAPREPPPPPWPDRWGWCGARGTGPPGAGPGAHPTPTGPTTGGPRQPSPDAPPHRSAPTPQTPA